ncbi:hypothetical protein AgCh_009850 [Apium graveolens]
MNKLYGFEGEVKSKLNDVFMELFAKVFCYLLLAHALNGMVFVVHGGLISVDGVKLSDIRKIDRFCEPPEEGWGLRNKAREDRLKSARKRKNSKFWQKLSAPTPELQRASAPPLIKRAAAPARVSRILF